MTEYTLINPITGLSKIVQEYDLTRKIASNDILFRENEHIGIVTHRDLVVFVRWLAAEILARAKGTPAPETQYALILVDRWLEDQQSVSNEELKAAADAAQIADAAARAASRAAAKSRWDAAQAAWAAARTAETAAWADGAAARAAWTADAAAWADGAAAEIASYEAQARWLVQHLQSGN